MPDLISMSATLPFSPVLRTIARASGTSVSLVLSVAIIILADGAKNGVTTLANEDIASALDIPTQLVTIIKNAMEDRLLNGDRLINKTILYPSRTIIQSDEKIEDKEEAELRKQEARKRHQQRKIENGIPIRGPGRPRKDEPPYTQEET